MMRGCPSCRCLVIQTEDGSTGGQLLLEAQVTTSVLGGVDPAVRARHAYGGGPAWTMPALVRHLMRLRSTTEQGARDLIDDDYEWHALHACPIDPQGGDDQ